MPSTPLSLRSIVAFTWLWLRFAGGFLFVAVMAVVWMLIALLLLPWRALRIRFVNYYGKIIGYSITRLAAVRPIIKNRERLDGSFPAIYVANHTSALDGFLSIWLCPVGGCGVMKKEVYSFPFFGWLYRLSGHLAIDRAKGEQAIAALDETARLVKRHRLGLWIMPEGTRSRDGRLLPFKPGFVHMAIATGLPVVPVVYHEVHKVWEKGTLLVEGRDVRIEVLPPIDTRDWKAETARAHAEEVYALFVAALDEDQKPLPA